MVTSIYLNKTTLIGYVDKQFVTITDQEVEQKAKAMEQLYVILTLQFPGFFVPKPTKRMLKTLKEGLNGEKREVMKGYVKRLADYQYLI
jgi:hypothetical protein